MSHSEPKKPNPEEEERSSVSTEEVLKTQKSKGKSEPNASGESREPETEPTSLDSEIVNDPRFSRLMKMQSHFVTEETLRSTEEKAKPEVVAPKPEDDLEAYDDEDEEDYDDLEEGDFDDDFDDDDYEDEEAPEEKAETEVEEAAEKPQEEVIESELEPEETDHRVARLRKLRQQFVTEKDLEIAANKPESEMVYKEVQIEKVVCPNCQSEEPRNHKICGECGAKLPNITSVSEEKYNPGTLNVAVLKYYSAVEKLQKKEWNSAKFVEFLHERIEISESHIDGLLELVEESGSLEWLPEATELIMKSTSMLEESIKIMLDKVEDARAEQQDLVAEFETLLEEFEEAVVDEDDDSGPEPPEPPKPIEQRIREISFSADLENIKKANGMMLNTLRLIDEFQKKAEEELDVSL